MNCSTTLKLIFKIMIPYVVQSTVPDGIKIESNKFGRCLVATKPFSKGSIVYQASCDLVAGVESFTLEIIDGNSKETIATYELDTVNSVKEATADDDEEAEVRQLYGFDGFMNHSCEANIVCPATKKTQTHLYYDAIALRDINVGDELTCDYAVFDYECDGHEIAVCGCKSEQCRGSMHGFKNLTFEEKVNIIPYCDREVMIQYSKDDANVSFVDCVLPDGVGLSSDVVDEYYLVSKNEF
jgi:hypothetical protein